MSSTPSGFSAFFAELRRRRVFRVAAVYAVVAWLITQIAATTFPHLNLPGWMITAVIVLVALGFPIALVLAWAFDLTPEGVIRAEPRRQASEADASPSWWTGQRIAAVGGIAILALAGGAFVLLGGSFQRASAAVEELDRSIAVLPFGNLSADPENEYFSDGITDEILTTLANLGGLRVISRTSVMRYKDTEKSLREIASELGVAHILEGSVQRMGERVRINVQLVDVATDAPLWAERYHRPLADIFAVQSEIAQQIAQALRARISPDERARLERPRTANLTAHDYVLRGREFVRRLNPRDIEVGLELLRRARELDPTYADAYAALAEAFIYQYAFLGDRVGLDSTTAAARRAIALDPASAPAYSWLGSALAYAGDSEAALEAHRRAVELNPNASHGLADLYHFDLGRLDEAARWWRPALEGDPTNSLTNGLAGRTFLNLGMTARARLLYEKSLEFLPGFPVVHFDLSTTYLLEGKSDEATAQIQRMLAISGSAPEALLLAGYHALRNGDLPAARRYFEQGLQGLLGSNSWDRTGGTLGLAWVLQQSGETRRARDLTRDASRQLTQRWGGPEPRRPDDYADLARVRVLEGDREGALQTFEESVRRGWRRHNEGINNPILESLRGDPRYDRLMAEVEADVDRMRARVEREGW